VKTRTILTTYIFDYNKPWFLLEHKTDYFIVVALGEY